MSIIDQWGQIFPSEKAFPLAIIWVWIRSFLKTGYQASIQTKQCGEIIKLQATPLPSSVHPLSWSPRRHPSSCPALGPVHCPRALSGAVHPLLSETLPAFSFVQESRTFRLWPKIQTSKLVDYLYKIISRTDLNLVKYCLMLRHYLKWWYILFMIHCSI